MPKGRNLKYSNGLNEYELLLDHYYQDLGRKGKKEVSHLTWKEHAHAACKAKMHVMNWKTCRKHTLGLFEKQMLGPNCRFEPRKKPVICPLRVCGKTQEVPPPVVEKPLPETPEETRQIAAVFAEENQPRPRVKSEPKWFSVPYACNSKLEIVSSNVEKPECLSTMLAEIQSVSTERHSSDVAEPGESQVSVDGLGSSDALRWLRALALARELMAGLITYLAATIGRYRLQSLNVPVLTLDLAQAILEFPQIPMSAAMRQLAERIKRERPRTPNGWLRKAFWNMPGYYRDERASRIAAVFRDRSQPDESALVQEFIAHGAGEPPPIVPPEELRDVLSKPAEQWDEHERLVVRLAGGKP